MKISIRTLLFILTVVVFSTCTEKDVDGDLSGDQYVRGRLLLIDELTQQATGTPLAKKKIFLSYADSPDTLNYLNSVTTDDQGYFIFDRLRSDKEYKFYYEEKVGDLNYTARRTAIPPKDTLLLPAYPNTNKQNGIHITVTDESGSQVKNATVCIFSNVSAYAGGTCDGNTYSLTTDDFGRAFKFSIPRTTYYIRTSFKFGNTTLTALDTLKVEDTVVRTNLTLRFAPASNSISYLVLDTANAKVAGVNVCFFTSPQLHSTDSCAYSNFQAVSDINGIAVRQAVPQGRYYVYGVIGSNNVFFIGRDTIDVGPQALKDTLYLRRK